MTANPRRDPHRYRGPRGRQWVRSLPTMHEAVCQCGWVGPARVTRAQAATDHRVHAEREAAELW